MSYAGDTDIMNLQAESVGSIHLLPVCPKGIHWELALCLCVSLYLAHSSYPVNVAIDTRLPSVQPCLATCCYLTLPCCCSRVCQNCLPARLIMPRGHRLWVLPISQEFTLEMTRNTHIFFFNLMTFDYTKSHFHLGRFQGLNHSWRKAHYLLLIKTALMKQKVHFPLRFLPLAPQREIPVPISRDLGVLCDLDPRESVIPTGPSLGLCTKKRALVALKKK